MAGNRTTACTEHMTFLAALAASVTLLLAGGMTGVFLAFSTSVLPGLDALEAGQSVPAMQSMNDKILNPLFLTTFTGVPVAAVTAGAALLVIGERAAGLVFLLAAAAYILGAFLPTAAVNVPLNNALAAAGTPAGPEEAARAWAGFSPRWQAWNRLRTAAGALCLLLTGLGLYLWGRQS